MILVNYVYLLGIFIYSVYLCISIKAMGMGLQMRYNINDDESINALTDEVCKPVRDLFTCNRASDNIDWMLKVNYNELTLLSYFASKGGMKGVFELTPSSKYYISKVMGLSDRVYKNALSGLLAIDYIRETPLENRYLINPLTVYRGNSKQISSRAEYYLGYDKNKDFNFK